MGLRMERCPPSRWGRGVSGLPQDKMWNFELFSVFKSCFFMCLRPDFVFFLEKNLFIDAWDTEHIDACDTEHS